jgi:hypothetical protein
LVLSFVPSLAWGDEPLAQWVQHRVDEGLVKPLAKAESSRFSRLRPPPHERRIRATQVTASVDRNGNAFVPFAIDVRFGSAKWNENDIVGCAYRSNGALFVKKGDAYRPAEFLLGKNVEPVAGACEAAPTPRA